MFFILIGLLWSSLARPVEGQTMSFFHQVPEVSGFTRVAVDASGVYAFRDSRLHKYDSRGHELWMQTLSVRRNIDAATAGDGVYVLGIGETDTTILSKYSPEGNELWTRQLEAGSRLVADATGVYVSGRNLPGVLSRLAKYSPEGQELWSREFGDVNSFPRAVAVDTTGVYVASANVFSSASVRKWGIDGSESGSRNLLSSRVPLALKAADPAGFYLIATDPQGVSQFLRKYDANGEELWSHGIEPTPDPNLISVAADRTGVYLAGKMPAQYGPFRPYSVLPGQCRSGSGGDSFVRKYDAGDGTEVWARQFGTSQATWASDVAVDAGAVYVVGEEGAAQVRDDFEHFEAFRPAMPGRSAFLARFEKTTAEVTKPGPRIFEDCVVNAASHVGGGVAPGEMVTILGSHIGPPEPVLHETGDQRLPATLAETRILFNGVAAPLLCVSDAQSRAIVPYGVAGKSSVDVQVEYKGVLSEAVTLPVLDSRPGIFTMDGSGNGQGMIRNEDGSLNSRSNPAARGSVITVYATGGGETAPGVEEGQILSDALPQASLPVWALFDLTTNEFQVSSKPAEVLYAGGVAGSVAGLLQIKLRVPADAVAIGPAVWFLLIIGSHWTVYDVTLSLR